MAGQINVQPQNLDLFLYSGDGLKVKLTCKTADDPPGIVDITGSVKAEIRNDRVHPDDPPLVAFAVDLLDAYLGIVKLSLTGDQTKALTDSAGEKNFVGVWDVEWDPATEEPRTLCQGKVECVLDVTQ